MKVALSAPLDNDSMPKAPLPANKSKQRDLAISNWSQSNRPSLIRFPVGLSSDLSGNVIVLDLNFPEIMRTELGF